MRAKVKISASPALKALAAKWWDEILCGFILLILALFLLGVDVIGINGPLSFILAAVGGLVLPVVLFFMATLVLPLLAFLTAAVAALVAAAAGLFTLLLAPLLTLLVTAVVLPVVTFFTGLVGTLTAWLAATWLGSLLAPVINVVTPLLLKFGPWLAGARNATWAYNKLKAIPFIAAILAAYFSAKSKQQKRQKPVIKAAKAIATPKVVKVKAKPSKRAPKRNARRR